MAKPSKKAIVQALLDAHGRTYAEEIGFDPAKNTPAPLFRLLCASLLFSARISADIAVRGRQGAGVSGLDDRAEDGRFHVGAAGTDP